MNNLAEVCFVGLGVGGKYLRCLVIVVKSVGNGGAKRCGADFKVMILRGKVASHKEVTVFIGGVDSSIHHEVGSHYVILLFWKFYC